MNENNTIIKCVQGQRIKWINNDTLSPKDTLLSNMIILWRRKDIIKGNTRDYGAIQTLLASKRRITWLFNRYVRDYEKDKQETKYNKVRLNHYWAPQT